MSADNAGQIRNIQQSVQYRDVIKQASDIVVYIDGQDYMVNPYLGDEGVTVPINDYVTSWQSSYDLDTMIPSGSLTLTVAQHHDHLFRAPGGNNILKSMADIRVYAKGYYLSPRGNTLYHQIFKGFISNIAYTPTGMTTTITIACFGALGILERMQVDQNPSTMSSAPMEVTPYTSTSWNLDPYQSIAWVFLYSSMIDGFEQYSIVQAAQNANNPYHEAVNEQYVAKWQALLYDLARDVHVFGSPNVNDVIAEIALHVKAKDATNTDWAKEALGALGDNVGAKTEVTQVNDNADFYEKLRGYMPDFGIGTIQLINGRVTSRLERLRYLVNLVGFEAYQDVDGGIVIKPPLYNLDVMNLDNNGQDKNDDTSLVDITNSNNPFVVQLAEILSETETEDEAAVRMTRVTARGNYNPAFQWSASKEMLATAEDIDIAKLSQFGLRTEPPREAHWFRDSDEKALYAFAASEMARANRSFRTYTITIPLRPELKLGFPMYLSHKDIYGYIKAVNMSWTRGTSATTTVTLDSLRRRPMLPETQLVDVPGQEPRLKTFMTPQTNLIMQWTKAAQKPASGAKNSDSQASLDGNLASLPLPQKLVVNQALQIMDARQRSGSDFGVNPDSTTNCWRIQFDIDQTFDHERSLSNTYYADLRTQRPYTDQKGYEVIGPFPWGRWKSLKDALTTFTIADALGAGDAGAAHPVITPYNPEAVVLSNADAFLFTGDAADVNHDSATELSQKLIQQAGFINSYKVFELAYDETTATSDAGDSSDAQEGMGSNLSASVPANDIKKDPEQDAANRAKTMLSGEATNPSLIESILNSVKTDLVPVDGATSIPELLKPKTPFPGFGGGSSGGGGASGNF